MDILAIVSLLLLVWILRSYFRKKTCSQCLIILILLRKDLLLLKILRMFCLKASQAVLENEKNCCRKLMGIVMERLILKNLQISYWKILNLMNSH